MGEFTDEEIAALQARRRAAREIRRAANGKRYARMMRRRYPNWGTGLRMLLVQQS
jgi:hypothetical protein